jgi:GAF domain-containing protein
VPNEPDALAERILSIAVGFTGDASFDSTLRRLCDVAVAVVPGTEFAGVTMIRHGRPVTAAFSDPEWAVLDAAQYESGRGPCLQAFLDGAMYEIDDTAEDVRWPEYAANALAHGVRSTLALPLVVAETSLGALNLYSHDRGAFAADRRDELLFFSRHASALLADAQAFWSSKALSSQLQEAMESREVIDQAVGILMERQRCRPEEALEQLRLESQAKNRKVRDLARALVHEVGGSRTD